MNKRTIDLNLLVAFEALLAERSVTRAAQRLGVTQPAMSNSLRRLRVLLDDPVFVRSPRGMLPTPRALALGPSIEAALGSIRNSIEAVGFDPRRSAVRFVIATLDYMEAVYLPALIANIEAAGPGIRVLVKRLPSIYEVPQGLLASGAIDCALSLFPLPLTPQSFLSGQICGREDWVCIARKGHPGLRRRLTLPAYARLKQLSISYPESGGPGMIDRLLAAQGLTRVCPASVPHFGTLPFHVAGSDCVATIPRRQALPYVRALNLQVAEVPFIPASDVSLVWHARVEADPAHVWFRKQVIEAVQALQSS